MEIKGNLIKKSETTQISETFKKREFVVEYIENPQYPEYIKFELIQDKCSLIDNVNINDTINIHFNLKGRKWTNPQGEDVYFNSLQAWKILPGSDAKSTIEVRNNQTEEPVPEFIESDEETEFSF